MREHQKKLDKWFKKHHWQYWHQLAQFARLVEETGELARILNHLYGEKPKKDTEARQELEEEIGDVLYTIICIANSSNIDLDQAIKKSFAKVMKRDKDRY